MDKRGLHTKSKSKSHTIHRDETKNVFNFETFFKKLQQTKFPSDKSLLLSTHLENLKKLKNPEKIKKVIEMFSVRSRDYSLLQTLIA